MSTLSLDGDDDEVAEPAIVEKLRKQYSDNKDFKWLERMRRSTLTWKKTVRIACLIMTYCKESIAEWQFRCWSVGGL